jgi:hypothetical protein
MSNTRYIAFGSPLCCSAGAWRTIFTRVDARHAESNQTVAEVGRGPAHGCA